MVSLADLWRGLDWLNLAYGAALVAAGIGLRFLALHLFERGLAGQPPQRAAAGSRLVLKAAVGYGLVLAGLIAGLASANLPDAPWRLATYAWRIVNTLLIIYCGVLAYSIALSAVRAYLRRARTDGADTMEERILPLLRDVFKLAAVVLIAALGIQVWGYSPATLLTGVGIGGLALAFAAQDTIANVFGSLVIYSDRPFKVGDWVEIDGVTGIVEEIGIRSTRVRTFDNCLVSFPNKLISSEKLHNWQAMTQRRVRFHLGISAANAPEAVERALADLRQLMGGQDLVASGMWLVYAEQLEDARLGILVQAYLSTTDHEAFLKTQEALMLAALKVLRQHGLSVALPLEVQSEEPGPARLGVPRADA